MKPTLILVAALALGVATLDADAAKRFGGGGNLGSQRATPTAREAAKPAPTATPAKPEQAAPAQAAPAAGTAAAAAAQPKPTFMSRWGGLLAGLGIGALLASLFGAQLAPFVGGLLALLLVAGVAYLVFRMFAGRRAPPEPKPAQFAGIGANLSRAPMEFESASPVAASQQPDIRSVQPSFEVEAFLRVAKTSFVRLQAANDAKDLEDIRDYTTSEMYAEIAMQLSERGDAPQRTEVVSLEARLVDVDVEDGYEIASVRFWGLIREAPGANPEAFDEIWHVRKKYGDRKAPWLIAGIQQTEPAGM